MTHLTDAQVRAAQEAARKMPPLTPEERRTLMVLNHEQDRRIREAQTREALNHPGQG